MSSTILQCDRSHARPFRRAAAIGRAAAAALVAACGVACLFTGAPRVTDRLDPVTGNTVTVLEKPIELVTVERRGPSSDPFAFAAPFDVDRMGHRELYLWVSIPQEAGAPSQLRILCDASPLDLPATHLDPGRLQLSRPPYPPVAPWTAEWSLRLPPGALACLAAARRMTIEYRLQDGDHQREERFTTDAEHMRGFAAFAARLGVQ